MQHAMCVEPSAPIQALRLLERFQILEQFLFVLAG